jgi:hypothetical protein
MVFTWMDLLLYVALRRQIFKQKKGWPTEAKFLVWLRYDAGTILETMPKLGYDHHTAFSEKQQGTGTMMYLNTPSSSLCFAHRHLTI